MSAGLNDSTVRDSPQMTHRQILTVISGLMLGMLLAALDQTIVGTALPTIVGDLQGLEHYSWVVTAYLLTATASTPLYGKISDLYGRKRIFQSAIVIFLIGSALAGLSQNMGQLIAFRAIQGLGAGGLMALALAIVGDIIPPRERGRYQGYFGAVFAVSSVAGPLLGGLFVDNLSWRWIFYINLPVGLAALMVTSAVLNLPFRKREASVDYLGATLLVAGVSAILLVTTWTGTAYGWASRASIALAAVGVVLLVVFAWWESRVAEPILPPRLFRNRVFTLANATGFVIGLAMFGAIIYLPIYLQIVDGVSPTVSGLRLLPLMVGLLGAAITSGRIISHIGRYKIFPIMGTAIATVGMYLLSYLDVDTPAWLSGVFMAVLGVGIGLVMQVLVLAVQNSVDPSDMGTATGAATFFRSMGGAFGTAIFGTILTSRLTAYLQERIPGGTGGGDTSSLLGSPDSILALPAPMRDAVVESFVRALHVVYLAAIPFTIAAFVFALFLPEIRLRSGHDSARGDQPADEELAAAYD